MDEPRVVTLPESLLWLDRLQRRPTAIELATHGLAIEMLDVMRAAAGADASPLQRRVREHLRGRGRTDPTIAVHGAPAEELAPYDPGLDHLLMRLSRSLTRAGLASALVLGTKLAVAELLENVAAHSRADDSIAPGMVAYRVSPGCAEFVVADVGQGAFTGLRDHRPVSNDLEALRACVLEGATRRPDSTGGRGLGIVQQRVVDAGGELAFWSGAARVTVSHHRETAQRKARATPCSAISGFFASGRLRWRQVT